VLREGELKGDIVFCPSAPPQPSFQLAIINVFTVTFDYFNTSLLRVASYRGWCNEIIEATRNSSNI